MILVKRIFRLKKIINHKNFYYHHNLKQQLKQDLNLKFRIINLLTI